MKDKEIKIRIRGELKEVWQKEAAQRDITLTGLIMEAMEEEVGLHVFGEDVPTGESVPTGEVEEDPGEEEFETYFK